MSTEDEDAGIEVTVTEETRVCSIYISTMKLSEEGQYTEEAAGRPLESDVPRAVVVAMARALGKNEIELSHRSRFCRFGILAEFGGFVF